MVTIILHDGRISAVFLGFETFCMFLTDFIA